MELDRLVVAAGRVILPGATFCGVGRVLVGRGVVAGWGPTISLG